MGRLSAKLTDRLDEVRAYPVGISGTDIAKLKLTPDLIVDMLCCLSSSDFVDQQLALMFLEILVFPGGLPKDQERQLVTRLLELVGNGDSRVYGPCYKLLARFRSGVSNFRGVMLEALKSRKHEVRRQALIAYDSYCEPKEVTPLEAFEQDQYTAETGMNGPLVYELRNLALETIERVLGKTFQKTQLSETMPDGSTVSWWDWSPYRSWKASWLRKFF